MKAQLRIDLSLMKHHHLVFQRSVHRDLEQLKNRLLSQSNKNIESLTSFPARSLQKKI
jgi:hypothetical protein